MYSSVVVVVVGGGATAPPRILALLEFFFLSYFFCLNIQNLGLESPTLEECGGKIGILSTHNLLSEIWSCLLENCDFLPPPFQTFLTQDAAK